MKNIRIRLRGQLSREWWDWFGDLTIDHTESHQTTLAGPLPDMAAVYGLLETIRNLGLEMISVHVESETGTITLDGNGGLHCEKRSSGSDPS